MYKFIQEDKKPEEEPSSATVQKRRSVKDKDKPEVQHIIWYYNKKVK